MKNKCLIIDQGQFSLQHTYKTNFIYSINKNKRKTNNLFEITKGDYLQKIEFTIK